MEFTTDQKAAIDTFNQFDFDETLYRCFVLSGYAGTGKTTLISYIVKHFRTEKRKLKLIAPTGRAAKVMASYADFPAGTIHKLIYFISDSVDGGGLIKAKNLHKNTLFIVDEASMVGVESHQQEGSLLHDLLEYVFSGEGCSLMLVGDPGQLPPVGQTDSPALQVSYIANLYPSLRMFAHTLTEVVRQAADSAITTNATFLRTMEAYNPPYFVSMGKEVISLNGSELLETLEASRKFGDESFVMLTISNKRAGKWNQEIRNRLFQYEETVVRGEWLMVVKNNYFWAADSEMGLIANGEMLQVIRIIREEHLYGFDFIHVDVSFLSEPNKERTVICFKETLLSDAPNFPREVLKQLFFEIEKDYASERNKRKRYQLILKNPYFNALQIKYAYCITAHKAQGGQWDAVFVDYGFIPEQMDKKEYVRWLYTCVTRAKHCLYLVNFPETYFQ
jgi:exodeoxyribonuclease-5